MGFISRLLRPRNSELAPPDARILAFGPAILRLSINGKETPTELDALAKAVVQLQHPPGYSPERVLASASEMARMIRIEGIEGIADRMRRELAPDLRAQAMRLALLAVCNSALGESDDIAILAGIAERIGIGTEAFEALYEAARASA